MAIDFAEFALGIVENHRSEMPQRYENISICLSTTYYCMGDPERGRERVRTITNVEEAIEDPKSETGLMALAHTELAFGMLMNGHYKAARNLAREARIVLRKTPEFQAGTYWHQWVDQHYAWSLIETGDAQGAVDVLDEMLVWLEKSRKLTNLDLKTQRFVQAPRLRQASW